MINLCYERAKYPLNHNPNLFLNQKKTGLRLGIRLRLRTKIY